MKYKRTIIGASILIFIIALLGVKKLETAMIVGAGSKARFLCSNVFISGRTPESVIANEACNATRNLGFLGILGDILTLCDVNQADHSAACRLLWIKRKAVFQDQLGATLLDGTGTAQIRDSEKQVRNMKIDLITSINPHHKSMPWPFGVITGKNDVSDNSLNRLKQLIERAFDDTGKKIPSRTHGIVVVHEGKLIAERYATDLGYSFNTPHYGWSMTKSVAAILVGILVKQDKLDIYEPAPIQQWQDPNDPRSLITTDHLLRMSSGLAFNEDYDIPISDVNAMLFGNHRDMVAFAADKPLITDPDTQWDYSTGTSTLLGAVIRHSLDNEDNFAAFVRRELFDKLGMQTAFIESDQSGNPGTGSFMWASPRDWARFGLFCLQNGRWQGEQILPEDWMYYVTKPTPTDPLAHYGAQFWLNSEKELYPSLPEDLYECRGKDIQRVTIIPSEKLVVARFGYTPDNIGWDHEVFVRKVLDAISR